MTKTIHIERQAFGSKVDNIGDTTLYYSANCSSHPSDVQGQFLDNPPKLSPRHASLVWRYNADVDKYLLIHVQGSHVINSALGRQYTFRAGYEVSRDDMNAINFRLAPLFKAMPKMNNMQLGRVESQTKVDINSGNDTHSSNSLASHLLKAVVDGQPLYISIDGNGEGLKNDGVFESKELKTLLATIDSIAVDKRRYITFGFCVDDYFASVLKDVSVIIYLKDSLITIPKGVRKLSWNEATTTIATPTELNKEQEWRGANAPLWTPKQLSVMRRTVNGTDNLVGEEWKIWLSLGHQFSELFVSSWPEFTKLYEQMDAETRKAFINSIKNESLLWPVSDLTEERYWIMSYNDEQTFELQKKTLNGYLLNSKESCFSFLFKRGLTKKMKKLLRDVEYLHTLQITSREDVLRWYEIYRKHGFLSEPIKELFSAFFCKYTECTLEEVMSAIQSVAEKKGDYLTEQYLMKVNVDVLTELLRRQPTELICNSGRLIVLSRKLSGEWKTFRETTLIPAVINALKTDDTRYVGPLSEKRIERLIDSESYYWKLKKESSSVYKIVEKELNSIRKKHYDAIIGREKNVKKTCVFIRWLIILLIGISAVLWYFTIAYNEPPISSTEIEMVADTLVNEEAFADTLINTEAITDTLTNKETNIDNGRTEY